MKCRLRGLVVWSRCYKASRMTPVRPVHLPCLGFGNPCNHQRTGKLMHWYQLLWRTISRYVLWHAFSSKQQAHLLANLCISSGCLPSTCWLLLEQCTMNSGQLAVSDFPCCLEPSPGAERQQGLLLLCRPTVSLMLAEGSMQAPFLSQDMPSA